MKKATIGLQQSIITDGPATEVAQPADCPLDDPTAPVPAQSAAVLMRGRLVIGPSRNNGLNAALDQQGSDGMMVLAPVGHQAVGPLAGASRLMRAEDRDGHEGCFEEPDLRRGRRPQGCFQRSTRTIDQYSPRCAVTARGRSDFGAPFSAGAKPPSMKHSFQWSGWRSLSGARKAPHRARRTPSLPPLGDDAYRGSGSPIAGGVRSKARRSIRFTECLRSSNRASAGGRPPLDDRLATDRVGTNLLSLGLGQVVPHHQLSFRERGSWCGFYLRPIGFEMTTRLWM